MTEPDAHRAPVAELSPNPTATDDRRTADAFATSWNHVGQGSVYTWEQYCDWIAPLAPGDLEGREVLELGFGNGSLLVHTASCKPRRLAGIDLGDTLTTTRANLAHVSQETAIELHRGDLTTAELGPFDIVYCIGVLHHLQRPEEGFASVLRHTRPGGRFHCWVYSREGNFVVRTLVEPVRWLGSRLPWRITKWGLALPLVAPYFLYAKALSWLSRRGDAGRDLADRLPLGPYSQWIAKRGFRFFHHVAFDQLVTPQTAYLERGRIERWLEDPAIETGSTYLVARNGNSWKFGGRIRAKRT